MTAKTISIHGKEYTPVSERVRMAHEELKNLSITTEVVPNDALVLVKATVVTPKGTFTGMSAANPTKMIEKVSPYEVAETSAVGRALGFAGYGITEGIASADEMKKAEAPTEVPNTKKTVLATQKQIGMIAMLLAEKGHIDQELYTKYNVQSKKDLTIIQASQIIENLMKLPNIEKVNPDEIPEDFGK